RYVGVGPASLRRAREPACTGIEPGPVRLVGDGEGERIVVRIRCGRSEAGGRPYDGDGRRRPGDLRCAVPGRRRVRIRGRWYLRAGWRRLRTRWILCGGRIELS